MSKICRTCLQKTDVAFSVNQLHEFGSSIVKISYVLRFCMPELYLGLSTNPEICYECKQQLETSYLFKRKCLNTEVSLGNYLKSVRCTGKSVQLQDVLSYMNDERGPDTGKDNVVNAQDIIAEWEDMPEEEGDTEMEIPLVEVRQSAPNPPMSLDEVEPLSPELRLTRYIINTKNHFSGDLRESVMKSYSKTGPKPPDPVKINPAENDENTEGEFPKITSVFSLSKEETIDNASLDIPGLYDSVDDFTNVKTEPIEIEHNGLDYKYPSTDEETLDASETASYENMQCESDLQGILDSIPDINDCSQYVDIPEFVQINNFGPQELEELRKQQLQAAPTIPNDAETKSTETIETSLAIKSSVLKSILVSDKLFKDDAKAPKKINGYRVIENDPTLWPLFEEPSSSATEIVEPKRPRGRRRPKFLDEKYDIKFVKNKLCNTYEDYSCDDKRVVVLFTNYTLDGRYVNDHDYLLNPYKRNKILIRYDNEWVCMCYICNYQHKLNYHVRHMNIHSSVCKECGADMGTPFMLNGHVRGHEKFCSGCNQLIPYGQIDTHLCANAPLSSIKRRRRRRKVTNEKPTEVLTQSETKDIDISIVEEQPVETDVKTEQAATPKRRGRKRKIKIEECSPPDMNYRVLRSMPRKLYSETDVDSGLSAGLENVASSVGS